MDGGALHFGGVVIPVCAGPSPRVGGTTDEPRTIRTSGTADELGTRGYAERIPPEMPCVRCASASGRRLQSTGQRKEAPAGVDGGVPARASVSRADWKNRASSLCMWVSRSDPGTGFVRSRQRFAHRSHVGLIEREAPSCESCGWCATGGAQKSRFGRGRGPRMDSKMPARDPQAAYTYVALHSVQVHWPDRRPRAGLRGVEMRTPQEGGASNGVQNLGMGCRGTGSRGSIPPMLMLRVRGFVKGFL